MANGFLLRPLPMTVNGTGGGGVSGSGLSLANDYAGMTYRGALNGSGNAFWIFDLGSNVSADTVMMFGVASSTTSINIHVQAATAAQGPTFPVGSWASFTTMGFTPLYAGSERLVNGKGVSLFQAPTADLPPPSRYWMIIFYGAVGAEVEASRVVIGKRTQLERNFGFGGAFGLRTFGKADFSARGSLLRTHRDVRNLRTVGLTFSDTYKDEVEATVAPLLELAGNTEPVALVTDPATHAMRERRCYFGPLVGDLGFVQRNAVGWEWRANLVSLF